MTLGRLVIKEILHRKLNFGLGVFSVLVAVGCLVAELTLLTAHDVRTEQILAAKEERTASEMRQMEDDYRKIMKKLGFNILILPQGQQLSDFYADGYASKYMPEEYATKLAESKIITVRHLLPTLEQRIKWPEQNERTIIVVGTRGEIPLLYRAPRRPMLIAMPPDSIVVGYELARTLKLNLGDKVQLLGREFKVSQCREERGNKDDITVWIDLQVAQELLNKNGLINGIWALECGCAWADVGKVRQEIAGILPGTQIIEKGTKAITRAEARYRAAAAAEAAVAAEKAHRGQLREEKQAFAAWLVPLVIVGCIVWIGLLAFSNVRERSSEIGILRALGLRSRQILIVFLSRAVFLGLSGAVLGYLAGFVIGAVSSEVPLATQSAGRLFNPALLLVILLASPLLSALASWVPARMAARQDPAVVLRQE